MHTLVMNLTRFGDLLQTQPVFSGLRAQGGSVELACLDSFQGAAALLRDVDQVRVLPGARLLAMLDRSWPEALQELDSWLDQARHAPPDAVLNLTPTLSARLLSRALHKGRIGGFGLDDHGFGEYSTPWAAFLQAASAHRGCSPFNLVDLFQRVAGLEPGEFRLRAPGAQALEAADQLLSDCPDSGRVAFQLGASQEYRRWPVSSFVQAGRVLWSRSGRTPVLLGTASEGHLAQEFMAQADYPCTDLTGRTDLRTLAAVLTRMDLLLTNDTGTMHLAAGLGVPVAAVFLATAQPFDTGPYLEGSLSLEPDLPCHPCSFGEQCPHGLVCRDSIDGGAVGDLLLSYLDCGSVSVSPELRARVWRARRDESGFMDLFSVSGHEDHHRSRWIRIQREVYRQFLDREFVPAASFWSDPDCVFRDALVRDLERGILMLTLIEEQGRVLALRPDAPMRPKFLVNCQNLEDFFSGNAALGVLGPMWRFQSRAESVSMQAFLELCLRYRELLHAFVHRLALA
jgi:ADP-heptose:LPS heptosyltransferase